jgi:hypothetical protein
LIFNMKKFYTDIDLVSNELKNVVLQNTTESSLETIKSGLTYFDTDSNKLRYYNGTSFVDLEKVTLTGTAPISTSGYTISHNNSGVTAGSYGPSANATPSAGSTFNVPYFTVNATGHVTAASTKTVTIPASIKNPNALTVNGNGTLSFTYDGSAAKTLNIKPGTYTSVSSDTSGNITVGSTIGTGTDSALGLLKGDGGTTVSISSGAITVKNNGHTHTSANITDKSTSPTSGSTAVITSGGVYTAISNLKNEILNTSNAMVFKGTLGTSGTVTALPTTYSSGDTYKVITAGTYAGQTCEIGDMIIAVTSRTTAADSSTDTSDEWTVVQSNIDGAVTGPTSSTAGHIATFTDASGKVIKDSGYTIATSVPSGAVFTDTKVTAVGNHYTPSGGTTTSASGGTLTDITNSSTGVQVVTGVTKDAAGHVTGVTSVALKSVNSNTDTKVNVTLGTTTKAYLLGTSTTPTSTATAVTTIADTGVYLDTTAGSLTATSFAGSGASLTSLNASNISSGTLASDRLPTVPASKLATSGVTAGSYGPSDNASPAHSGTFSVPYVTVDTYGRVTAASTKTITLPAAPSLTSYAKRTTVAVPAGSADTAITITHNLGITGVTIGSSTVYPAVVQVYETSTNNLIDCDVTLVNANSLKLTFSSAVTANQFYCVITG